MHFADHDAPEPINAYAVELAFGLLTIIAFAAGGWNAGWF